MVCMVLGRDAQQFLCLICGDHSGSTFFSGYAAFGNVHRRFVFHTVFLIFIQDYMFI